MTAKHASFLPSWLAETKASTRGVNADGTSAAEAPTRCRAQTVGQGPGQLIDLALRAKKNFPPAVFQWLQQGLRGYANEGRAGTLERHLGLNVELHKGRSAVRRLAVEKRWSALGAAYAAQIDCDDKAPFRRCSILVADLDEFEKLYWPAWRDGGPPKSPSRLRGALFDIFIAYDGSPPRNANSIYRALQQAKIIIAAPDSHV